MKRQVDYAHNIIVQMIGHILESATENTLACIFMFAQRVPSLNHICVFLTFKGDYLNCNVPVSCRRVVTASANLVASD